MIKLKSLIENTFRRLMKEASDNEEANAQAKHLGLAYAHFGRWKDPKTGKVVAHVVDGKLVRVDTDAASQAAGTQQMTAGSSAAVPRQQSGAVASATYLKKELSNHFLDNGEDDGLDVINAINDAATLHVVADAVSDTYNPQTGQYDVEVDGKLHSDPQQDGLANTITFNGFKDMWSYINTSQTGKWNFDVDSYQKDQNSQY
jgi:hypothetical protein